MAYDLTTFVCMYLFNVYRHHVHLQTVINKKNINTYAQVTESSRSYIHRVKIRATDFRKAPRLENRSASATLLYISLMRLGNRQNMQTLIVSTFAHFAGDSCRIVRPRVRLDGAHKPNIARISDDFTRPENTECRKVRSRCISRSHDAPGTKMGQQVIVVKGLGRLVRVGSQPH